MKKILCVAFALLVCCSIVCPAFASDGSAASSEPVVNVYNSVEFPANSYAYLGSDQQPLSASGGLKGVLVDFLGEWQSIVVEHTFVDEQGFSVTQVDVIPDYPWIASAVLLCLMVYCLFRVGGALICK